MKDDYVAVLLEDIQGSIQTLAESVNVMNEAIMTMAPQVAMIPEMAADIKTFKTVQADQGKEIRHIEQYLTAQGMPQRA